MTDTARLLGDARDQIDFFRRSLRADGGFDVLGWDGTSIPGVAQELHGTTRLVHSFALGHALGLPGCTDIIDAGMDFLWNHHRDARHGGYAWSVPRDGAPGDTTKLAYGHVFVLLAASSARAAGHPDAARLHADICEVIDRHFWDPDHRLLRDEFAADWTPFSTYRGMNANMHGAEAFLAAFEATGERAFLDRAGAILDFFIGQVAPSHGWRLPEHYTADWQVDPDYAGNPMFRPAGTTPGHSFEMARLQLQHWDLSGRPDTGAPDRARALVDRALADAWASDGGIVYTLDAKGRPAIRDRYWWPVTEAIGAIASLRKLGPDPALMAWEARLRAFAEAHFIDKARGGWFPEIDAQGKPVERQFHGKPDIYHALQACLIPAVPGLSRLIDGVRGLR
ncbi:AGE family epimerase/isomerase [Halovulum dunhuangense]|uniref:AGE family epimerase/isomerase n=1 Tax=Halovulum dunhuangense TaxID=1505036 RepID=A0A849L1H8_9RHOB|nr:AGE family epimerase/isomerase [Halovulum dunhuangense]NNU80097.1 AGE family epimerase/isomerase [Halovulum dunhuangense]